MVTAVISDIGTDAKKADKKAEKIEKVELPSTNRVTVPYEGSFTSDFYNAKDLNALADDVREKYRLADGVDILVLWKRKGGMEGGKQRLAKAQLTNSGLVGHFVPAQAVIWLAADHLAAYDKEKVQVILKALLHEQMSRIDYDDETEKVTLAPYDFFGQRSTLREFGLWRVDLEMAEAAFKQAALM